MTNNCCREDNSCDCNSDRENKMCMLTKPHNQFDIDKVVLLANNPKYVCRCCGRLANSAENLCSPKALNKQLT